MSDNGFGDDDDDDDDDDDMAELFSFGTEDAAPTISYESSAAVEDIGRSRGRVNSDDSLLDMLENEGVKAAGSITGGGVFVEDHDEETRNILDWLDTEDDDSSMVLEKVIHSQQAALHREESPPHPKSPAPTPTRPEQPTVVALPPVFSTLQEALDSKEATTEQIRQLALAVDASIKNEQRPELYSRLVCHKSLAEAASSSIADSFQEWNNNESMTDPAVGAVQDWIRQQALALSDKFKIDKEEDFTKLLMFQLRIKSTEKDPLVPAVAATLMATNLPVAACSVVLHQMIHNYMPLLALPQSERWQAALSIHSEFYLLAVYHLPLVVFHLDRYLPGWHWPRQKPVSEDDTTLQPTQKGRNLKSQGQLPPSWLLSHFAGECDGTFYLTLDEVWKIWDITFIRKDTAIRFFLTLALLEQAADALLLLTGDNLKERFESALVVHDGDANGSIDRWVERSEALQRSTPESVLSNLRTAEDTAVELTLKMRQEKAEQELKLKMEAEAAAHRLAQEKKAAEARDRLNRARLVAFYRKHMPDKESNVDTILTTYADRLEVLEKKLKAKYGEGFNPAIKQRQTVDVPKDAFKLLSTMNTGLASFGAKPKDSEESEPTEVFHSAVQGSVLVSVSEVLPVVCWTKEAATARGVERRRIPGPKYLKYVLVDSRTATAAFEQGRFPTSIKFCPETMMNPEKLKEAEDRCESLRGAVHIVIMGDGYAKLPELYDYKLNQNMQELVQEDQSRTQICALFFVKRGFPFVSVLDGGFAAAHSWLVRDGPKHDLYASSVLVDYVPEGSLFGQLESFHNASGTEKAQRRMQAVLDKSLTVVAKRAQQLENFANDLDSVESAAGFRNLFGRGASSKTGAVPQAYETTTEPKKDGQPGIRSFLSGLGKSLEEENEAEGINASERAGETKPAAESSPSAAESNEASSVVSTSLAEEGLNVSASTQTRPTSTRALDPTVNAFTSLWRRGTAGSDAYTNSNLQLASAITGASSEVKQNTGNESSNVGVGGGVGNLLKRNPFARLGAGTGSLASSVAAMPPKPQSVNASTPTGSGRGFGLQLDSLRRTAFQRGQSSVKNENDLVGKSGTIRDEQEEETISFSNSQADVKVEDEEEVFEIGGASEGDEDDFVTVSEAEVQQV